MSKRAISKIICLLIVSAGLLSSGCGKPWQNPGPDETFETFLLDLYTGKRESAFNSLMEEDRQRLTKALDTLDADVAGDALPERAQMLVTGRVDNPYDFKDISFEEDLTEEPKVGTTVELKLEYHDAREGSARVVWSGERWHVDLPNAVAPKDAAAEQGGQAEASRRGEDVAAELVERLQRRIKEPEGTSGSEGAEDAPDTPGDR